MSARIAKQVRMPEPPFLPSLTKKIDAISLHPVAGYFVLFVILFATLVVISLFGGWLSGVIAQIFDFLNPHSPGQIGRYLVERSRSRFLRLPLCSPGLHISVLPYTGAAGRNRLSPQDCLPHGPSLSHAGSARPGQYASPPGFRVQRAGLSGVPNYGEQKGQAYSYIFKYHGALFGQDFSNFGPGGSIRRITVGHRTAGLSICADCFVGTAL